MSSSSYPETPELHSFVRQAQRRLWWLNLLQALTLSTVGLFALATCLFLLDWLGYKGMFARIAWYSGIVLAVGNLVWHGWLTVQQAREEELTKQLEEWNPQIRGLLTAVELDRTLPTLKEQPMYSAELARARVEEVFGSLRKLRLRDAIPLHEFESRAYALFAVAAVFVALFVITPQRFQVFLHGMFFAPLKKASIHHPKTHRQLVVGDLKLTYQYPEYTRLPTRSVPNSDGNLSAVAGTVVKLEARSIVHAARAELLKGNKERVTLKLAADGRRVTGKMTLLKRGTYRFRIFAKNGDVHLGPVHTIELQQDQFPKVTLLTPDKDLKLQERADLPISYKFSDDYGISSIAIVYRNLTKSPKKEKRQVLSTFKKGRPPRVGSGNMKWELRSLPFSPGDKISFQIEVFDNDGVKGPKRTRSVRRVVKIDSPLDRHDRLVAKQKRLLNLMVLYLGDLLVRPSYKEAKVRKLQKRLAHLNNRSRHILSSFRALLPELRKDSYTKAYTLIALDNLRMRFRVRHNNRVDTIQNYRLMARGEAFQRGQFEALHKAEITPQEDDVYAFSLLLNRQRLDLIKRLSRKLTASQNRIRDLLEKYRKTKDPKVKKELLAEMRRMKQLIREIMRRMASLQRQIQDEYLNWQASKNRRSLKKLSRMQKAVKKDKLEDAIKELNKLARDIERMTSQMDRFSKQAGGGRSSRIAAAMRQLIDKLHQIEKKQVRLAQKTQNLRKNISKRMQKALKEKVKKLIDEKIKQLELVEKHLKEARTHLKPFLYRYRYKYTFDRAKQRLKEAKKLLKLPNILSTLQRVEESISQQYALKASLGYQQRMLKLLQQKDRSKQVGRGSRKMQDAIKLSEKIRDELRKFFPSSKPFQNEDDKRRLSKFKQQQQRLNQEARKVQRKMEQMSRRLPMFQRRMKQSLRQAIQQMQQAQDRLGGQEPRPAHRHQQQAISRLRKVRNQLKQSMKPQRRQGKGKKKSGGGRGFRNQKVKIPPAGKHKAPKALRQDIMDAMKDKTPKKFRKPVRKYYEKLVK